MIAWLRSLVTRRDIPRIGGKPYLVRYGRGEQSIEQSQRDRESGRWRVRLHRFEGPDDAGHHNHPFKWSFSIPLWGSYTEEVLSFQDCNDHQGWLSAGGEALYECPHCTWTVTTRRVRWINWIPLGKYHRIVKLHGRPVWTLFVMGPRVASWGFWVPNRGFVPWRTYNAEQGYPPEET
jgi:hypothetical protein